MNSIFRKVTGSGKASREYQPRVKTSGKTIDELSGLAKSKGLELYVDDLCKVYWIWKDGSTIDGQHDPFDTLPQVRKFLNSYSK